MVFLAADDYLPLEFPLMPGLTAWWLRLRLVQFEGLDLFW